MICDRIVIMNKGRVIREGSTIELTQQTGVVRFEVTPIPGGPALAKILEGVPGAPQPSDGGFTVPLPLDETDTIIDRLRAAGISIRAVVPHKLSLEESFLQAVQAEGESK